MGITYSPRATPALVRLFQRFNSINVYVEDEKCSNVYINLLNRILLPDKSIRKVFSLGGKKAVLAAAVDPKYQSSAPRLFIVDGDFDHLLGVEPPHEPNILRLGCYCLENVLYCEKAALEIALESSTDLTREAAKKALKFKAWRRKVVLSLFPLFVRYALSEELQTGCTTAGASVHVFLEGKGSKKTISKSKITKRLRELEVEILKHITRTEMMARESAMRKKIGISSSNLAANISGKNYLIPLLYLRLREVTEYRDAPGALTVRLSKYADIDANAPDLKAKLLELCA